MAIINFETFQLPTNQVVNPNRTSKDRRPWYVPYDCWLMGPNSLKPVQLFVLSLCLCNYNSFLCHSLFVFFFSRTTAQSRIRPPTRIKRPVTIFSHHQTPQTRIGCLGKGTHTGPTRFISKTTNASGAERRQYGWGKPLPAVGANTIRVP